MRNAKAVTQGVNANASTSSAPSKDKCEDMSIPLATASTAPVPKISTGMHSGSTSSDTSTPPPRKPNVSAAPTAPIILSIGVPSSRLTTSTHSAYAGISNCKPSTGAISISGRPDSIQCASILPSTNTDRDCGASSICSSVPSR